VRRVEGSFDETERDLNTSYVIFYTLGTAAGIYEAQTRGIRRGGFSLGSWHQEAARSREAHSCE
jgi:hypothetical protein